MRTRHRTIPRAGILLGLGALLLSPALVAGCAEEGGETAARVQMHRASEPGATPAPPAAAAEPAAKTGPPGSGMGRSGMGPGLAMGMGVGMGGMAGQDRPNAEAAAEAEAGQEPVPAATPARPAAVRRKIIYEGRVELVTKDLAALESDLFGLIDAQAAFLADSDRAGARGETMRGTWKVRVPVENYAAFVRGAIGLGELVGTSARSQDVGAEFYDLDARRAAKKVEEDRLLKHLAEAPARLDEILTWERELSRVRSEIERMQGRLAMLDDQTALATVTVVASQLRDDQPPPPPQFAAPTPPAPIPPDLGERVARTFARSLGVLRVLGEAALLVAVAVAPWLPLLLLIVPARILARWLMAPPADPAGVRR